MGTITLDDKGTKLNFSSHVDCKWISKSKIRIHLGKVIEKKGEKEKTYPCCTYNMQTDYANFDSLAFAIWSVRKECEIELEFEIEPYILQKHEFNIADLYFDKCNADRIQHYMRFLYRAWKMEQLYSPRFTIVKGKCSEEVDNFADQYRDAMKKNCLQYSAPNCKADVKRGDKITENHLEKWFALNGYKDKNLDIELYDQLPCGIFYEKEATDKRIFNKGAIDLWGINKLNHRICIFELKEKHNVKLGIISELFFYSCVLIDILSIGKGNRNDNYRGFQKLWDKSIDANKIHAYFLADNLHSFIKKHINEIIAEMNKRRDGKVEYGYCKFDQVNLVGTDESAFIKKLDSEWNPNDKKRV